VFFNLTFLYGLFVNFHNAVRLGLQKAECSREFRVKTVGLKSLELLNVRGCACKSTLNFLRHLKADHPSLVVPPLWKDWSKSGK